MLQNAAKKAVGSMRNIYLRVHQDAKIRLQIAFSNGPEKNLKSRNFPQSKTIRIMAPHFECKIKVVHRDFKREGLWSQLLGEATFKCAGFTFYFNNGEKLRSKAHYHLNFIGRSV